LHQSCALQLSSWLGHEEEGVWVAQKGQEQGKKAHGSTKEDGQWGDCHEFNKKPGLDPYPK
jgi:hypothetical protein